MSGGLLGERFRDLRCTTRATTCDGCTETATCDYARVFASEASARRLHPFWLQGVPAEPALDPGACITARVLVTSVAAPVLLVPSTSLRDALVRLGAKVSASRVQRVALPPEAPRSDALRWRVEAITPLVLRGDLDVCAQMCPRAPWLALLVRAGVRRLDALLRELTPSLERPRPNSSSG